MRKLTKIGIVLALAVVALAAQPVLAACTGALGVTNTGVITINGNGPYSYSDQPLGSASFDASFWSAGFGDPAVLAGNDSGTLSGLALTFGSPSIEYYGQNYLYQLQVFTNWGAGGVDGCVTNDGPLACTCVLINEDGTDGVGYFALGSAQRNATGDFNIPGNLDMVALPKPMILSSSRNGVGVDLMVTVPAPTGGLNLDPNCGGGCIVNGTYRVLAQEVPRGAPMPDSRNLGAWIDISGGETPLGQNAMVSAPCGAGDVDLYLTSVINFDSGFTGANVSGNSTLVNCGTTLAEPVEIKRPRPNLDRPDNGAKKGRVR